MAYIKLCSKCGKRSISASKNKWICPHCGADLTEEPVFREIRTKEKDSKSASSEEYKYISFNNKNNNKNNLN